MCYQTPKPLFQIIVLKNRWVLFVSWTHFSVHIQVCALLIICMNKEHVSLYLNMPVSTFRKCAYESVADHGNKYTEKAIKMEI